MTDYSDTKTTPSSGTLPALWARLLQFIHPFVGPAFGIGVVLVALSSFGPGVWTWIFSQSYVIKAPDFSVFTRLPWVILVHITGATSALLLGGIVLYGPKGTPGHKAMGRIWAVAMVTTATSSFFMKSFAPMLGQFGLIHILAIWTMISLPRAIWYARQGNIERHLKTMRGLYWGLCIAGAFTFIPGRTMYALLFG
jgi:uncharacterized membrane protein